MTIISLGAYDRFNYGDLLFAHMIDRASNAHVAHSSIAGGDLSAVGGHDTLPINRVMKDDKNRPSGIIIGGGDVLTASWFAVDWQLRSERLDTAYRIAHRLVPREVLNRVAQRVRQSHWERPFLPPAELCREMPVVYHAVGGSNVGSLPNWEKAQIAKELAASKLVTVRDRVTESALQKIGISSHVAPDSVAAMALEVAEIPSKITSRKVVIQTSDNWLRHRLATFASAAQSLISAGFDVAFLPIGLAAGHSDLTAYDRLKTKMPELALISVSRTEDIKAAIGEAAVFVGTSLHGHITAVALGTPTVALGGVSKLEAYVSTWAQDICPIVAEDSSLLTAINQVITVPASERNALRIRLGEQAEQNTKRCIEALHEL